MNNSSKKEGQIKAGVVLGYVNYVTKMGIQLLYVPLMLRLLGQSEYGVYQLVASLVSYLGLLNFGFGGAYLRFYSQCKGNREKEAELNGTYLTVFFSFAILTAIVGTVITINSEWILGNKLLADELNLAKKLLGILTINMVITFPISVFSAIVTAKECFIFQRSIELMKTIANPFLVIILLLLGKGSIGMVLVTTILTIVGAIANIWYVMQKIKAPFSFKRFNIKLVKEVGAFSFFLFLNSIIDQINWNVDKYLLGRFTGAISIAIYSVGAQINNIYIQITDMLATVLAPRVNYIVANEEEPMVSLNNLFVKVGRLQAFIIFLVVGGFVVFGREFIEIWAGIGYEEAYVVTLLLIIPVSIPLCQTLGVDIQRALNKHQYRAILYACVAVMNLFISIPLTRKMGAVGSALGTAVSLLIGNGIIMNIMYEKIIGLNIKRFWRQIAQISPTIILPVILSLTIKRVFPIHSIYMLIFEITLFIVIYGGCLLGFGMNVSEKREVFKVFLKFNIIK